ncbi:helix-turn-helix transcriptional regulator [Paludibacter sp.]
MSEKERIERILQMEKLSIGQFAQEIGITNSSLSHILNERNRPSLDVIKKILNRYPNINSDWLIFGQGSMFKKESYSHAPTLFEDEDETDSKSDVYSEKSSEKIDIETSPIQENTIRSIDAPEYTRITPTKDLQNIINQKRDSSTHGDNENQNLSIDNEKHALQNSFQDKKVTKVILYFSDNTFQEFDSK